MLYQVCFITARVQTDFMIKDPIPHHIYATKRRGKQNLFESRETYISSSSELESSSLLMSSVSDKSDAFSKPNKPLFVVFTIFTLVFCLLHRY